jgi:flagellar P-ring protein precursor FlgI
MLTGKDLSFTILAGLILFFSLSFGGANAERIKDITKIEGVRTNQLVGYGLVVGLNGTGDGSGAATIQGLRNMLSRLGINIPANVNLQAKNVAIVALHAELPAFARAGMKVDITLSSLGSSKSLRGGSLLMTPLRGADDEIYAIAQGSVIVSGFGAEGSDGSRITVNVPSVGRILNGATVEKNIYSPFGLNKEVVLNLNQPDFTTAMRLVRVINNTVGSGTSYAKDAGSIIVNSPADNSQRVAFISLLENLTLKPAEAPARIIINSRTGTVVIGKHVQVLPAAVAHGNLIVTITPKPQVSQPAGLSEGQTVVIPNTDIQIRQENNRMFKFDPGGVSLEQIVQAVNGVGAAPGDLVAILEALKEAGAIHAELIVI